MRISDISSAKGLKIKLTFIDASSKFTLGSLLRVEPTQIENEFLVRQYGEGTNGNQEKSVLCKTGAESARYIVDLLSTEKADSFRCLFSVDGIQDSSIEVQAYTFKSLVEYKTAIIIQVSDKLWEKTSPEKLYKEYVWEQLGMPALFSLNYKNRKKQKADVRFVSGKRFLLAHNTPRGVVAESENYLRDRDYLPIDIYLAPSIKFVPVSESAGTNETLAAELDKVSNPQTYFARWEAYNELSRKLLEQESQEFGEITYASYTTKMDLSGVAFEFEVKEELDDSYIGKELAVQETTDPYETDFKKKAKQIAVGAVRRISGGRVLTYLENAEGLDAIPSKGSLVLYTAGDKFILARRNAARDRMIKHEAPIKYIVALIETGASEYTLPSAWGSHKAITEELKRNFRKATDLNPEQEKALSIAINTPDIALIQGPPGTGKTTVIKAICERFREIYEAEERQLQKINPDHALQSPKILISSFQNEAVDNAISTPLPGDIPAYRKTAKRAKDSTKTQYQQSLDNWYAGVCNSISEMIEDETAATFSEEKRALRDEYLSFKNGDESPELAAKLIRHYLSFSEIVYPTELVKKAESIIRAVENQDDDDIEDPIVSRLEAQRMDMDAFADDGKRQANRLLRLLLLRDDIAEETVAAVKAVCEESFSDDEYEQYVREVTRLKKQYCGKRMVIDIRDRAAINECLIAMSECFNNQYMNTLTDFSSKKSLILTDFLSRLEQEYEVLVKKYSMTTAATCQTSLDLRRDSRKTFDLVVVDEAARANPLDLFIPMSMGKKIVLVGDHKQLPHMLEPDVLKLIMEDPRFKDITGIEKSLFERLFEMFSNGQYPKAVLLTHQFRMHPEICQFVSESFYDGQLKTSESITAEMRSSPKEINDGRALTFVNVPISKGAESHGVSKSRRVEVDAVCKEVKKIFEIEKNTKAKIGVITFYSAQATKIQQSLEMQLNSEEMSRVEVGTVDAFQGKEFDYVLLSCVRSNKPRGENELPNVGFLQKPNRLCVAFSRAIRQLIVFGDIETLQQIPCFSRLYELCAVKGGGCYREY